MRSAIVAGVLAALAAAPLAGQTETSIRRVQPKAFRFAVTGSAGFGFGSVRATRFDPEACTGGDCYSYGSGSGWQAGVDLQVPLGRNFGFELGGQIGHPSRTDCLLGNCLSPEKTWAYRGTALVLWRFKPRAPIYFGVGAAMSYFDPGPVLVYQDGMSTTEYGAATAVGFDFPFNERLGGTVVWRSYILAPSTKGLPDALEVPTTVWDNTFVFGVRFFLSS